MGGEAPKETIDELGEKFNPYAANTSRGHGLGIEKRDYDRFIEGGKARRNGSPGSGNVAFNGVPRGSAQKGNQGRLARDAQTVREMSQRANQAAEVRGVLDSSRLSSG